MRGPCTFLQSLRMCVLSGSTSWKKVRISLRCSVFISCNTSRQEHTCIYEMIKLPLSVYSGAIQQRSRAQVPSLLLAGRCVAVLPAGSQTGHGLQGAGQQKRWGWDSVWSANNNKSEWTRWIHLPKCKTLTVPFTGLTSKQRRPSRKPLPPTPTEVTHTHSWNANAHRHDYWSDWTDPASAVAGDTESPFTARAAGTTGPIGGHDRYSWVQLSTR